MSAKLLEVYVEENPDLEKHIGCMTGMFQMFGHRLMGRRLTGISHKRLPSSGPSLSTGSNQRRECSPSSPRIISVTSPSNAYDETCRDSRKSSNENRRASTETSRAYLSSSLSFPSSLERSKTSKSRSSDVDTKSVHSDFRDIVKDSINGQTRCLSVKTSSKEEVGKDRKLKHRDSPRPILPQDLNASLQVTGRFKESASLSEIARFSCDGREITRTKSTKVREMPRLSLDSRDSLRNSNFDPKLKELDKSHNQRVPSVLAKLMGLEAMPCSTSNDKGNNSFHGKSEKNQIFGTHRNSKTPTLKHSGETESVYNQIERSVKDLDFQESNKDLKALKHVLDTMEAKGLIETKRVLSQKKLSPHVTAPRALGSRVVIMKPSKSVNRVEELEGLSGLRMLRTSGSSSRKQVKDSPSEKMTEDIMPRPQQSSRGKSVSQVKTSSPRAQQRTIEVEKKPKVPIRRQQVVDSISPRIKSKVKANQAQKKSQQEKEVTGVDDDARTDSCSMKLDSNQFQQGKQKSLWIVNEEVSAMEPAIVSSEQPSPISVLDALFYHDEELSPSPVKRISTKLKDDDILKSSEMDSSVGKIKNLVQKLRHIGSNQEPVLEKMSLTKSGTEKLHQKLILDVVQEILVQKLESRKLGLCSEIESLLVERPGSSILENEEAISGKDLALRSEGWEDFCVEVAGLVLEIEKLMFKDLVDDIVSGEAESSLLGKRTNPRRQLFN